MGQPNNALGIQPFQMTAAAASKLEIPPSEVMAQLPSVLGIPRTTPMVGHARPLEIKPPATDT